MWARVPRVKFFNGFEIPLIGLGTYLVRFFKPEIYRFVNMNSSYLVFFLLIRSFEADKWREWCQIHQGSN